MATIEKSPVILSAKASYIGEHFATIELVFEWDINDFDNITGMVYMVGDIDYSYGFYQGTISVQYLGNNTFKWIGSTDSSWLVLGESQYKIKIYGEKTSTQEEFDTLYSDKFIMYLFQQPVITSNVYAGQLVEMEDGAFTFEDIYNQSQSAELYWYQYILYDSNDVVLQTGEKTYCYESPPVNMSYTFDGFINRQNYKIKIKTATLYGDLEYEKTTSFTARTNTVIADYPNVLEAECKSNADSNDIKITFYWNTNRFEPVDYMVFINNDEEGVKFINTEDITYLGDNVYELNINVLNSDTQIFEFGENSYQIKLISYDSGDEIASSRSNSFMMFRGNLPVITNSNISEYEVITESGYIFSDTYYQAQNDPLDYCQYTLYDANDNVLEKSDKIFSTNLPPIILYYYFNGFENNTMYKIGFYLRTQHGLEVSKVTSFNVEYDEPILKSKLKVENKCNEGYIDISSNIFAGQGITSPPPMVYIDEGGKYSAYAIASDPVIQYGSNTSRWIYWNNGIDIDKNFVLKFWFTLGSTNNNIIRMYDDDGHYINVKYKRLKRNNQAFNGDFIEISDENGNVIANSNILSIRANSTDKFFLWIKVVDDEWEVIIQNLEQDTSVFNWNDLDDNLGWNQTTDLTWEGEQYEDEGLSTAYPIAIRNNLTNVIVGNAICRQLEVTNNIEETYNQNFDDWDEFMVLKCDFDRNVQAGNLEEQVGNIDAIRIKRKDASMGKWITIFEREINDDTDLKIAYRDYGVPKGIEQTYALVPVLADKTEGNYITAKVVPNWNATFIYDGEQCFKLYSSITYGNVAKNRPVGVLNPIGAIYPTVIQNGENKYMSGMVSGQLLGYNYEQTRRLDRVDVTRQIQDFTDFLTNGRAKIIFDWNGNCWLARVTDSPTINYNIKTTNGVATVSFSWVEQGKYNNEEDLENNNLK